MDQKWINGMMGLIVGDALGCPVEFMSRSQIRKNPVTGMRGFGTFHLPAGSWTDDSSMALATLASIREKGGIDPEDMMIKFSQWLETGAFTPFGQAFDVGISTSRAISRFQRSGNVQTCGGNHDRDNGNGSLMRILPVVLFCLEQEKEGKMDRRRSIEHIHTVSALTHAHLCSKIACGLYLFMAEGILDGREGTLKDRLQRGLTRGLAFYAEAGCRGGILDRYVSLADLDVLAGVPDRDISGSGYVVDTLEAAVWCLITTDSFKEALLKAVNLGDDTDTVAAVAGGLAGLFYGMENIPGSWLEVIRRKDWILELMAG